MTWKRDALMVGALGGWLLRQKKEEPAVQPYPRGGLRISGEKGLVFEQSFDETEWPGVEFAELEEDEGYWVRQDGRWLGKVYRTAPDTDSEWVAVTWKPDGDSVISGEYATRTEASGWLR